MPAVPNLYTLILKLVYAPTFHCSQFPCMYMPTPMYMYACVRVRACVCGCVHNYIHNYMRMLMALHMTSTYASDPGRSGNEASMYHDSIINFIFTVYICI